MFSAEIVVQQALEKAVFECCVPGVLMDRHFPRMKKITLRFPSFNLISPSCESLPFYPVY